MNTIIASLLLGSLTTSVLVAGERPTESAQTWVAFDSSARTSSKSFEEKFKDRHRYLVANGYCTRIPTSSVLFLPEKYRGSLSKVSNGKMVPWPEFQRKNTNWLQTKSIAWKTVTGEEPLPEDLEETYEKNGRCVVALFKGFPISVIAAPTNSATAAIK